METTSTVNIATTPPIRIIHFWLVKSDLGKPVTLSKCIGVQ
jgi:hypothetical protein